MTPAECSFCSNDTDDLFQATVTDSSGGAFAQLCEQCVELLDFDRCGLCGAVKIGTERAEEVVVEGSEGVPVCDRCRNKILSYERVSA